MTLHGLHNEQYLLGREIGRGGEGAVYELQNDGSRVLKQYTEPLSAAKVRKLQQMVAMRSPAIEAYAAWPSALVADAAGQVCGFVMKKLAGFVPMHMIFSPLDRKKMFPDKGYNFLVHVARNLATAFHKLHEAGLIVGDVNEGNILINANGMVAFIDCDSFQVADGNTYFFCEVGVPRYTPPELLARQSFSNVVRTANTDNFSLAILIFQLLFLGRHPFAGRNKSAADIDEETAIKMHEFAYSLTDKKKKLLPPKDSFDITNLDDSLITNFHQAFETEQRPSAADWVKGLDTYLLQMVTCSESRLHAYPGKMKECPWCFFKRTRGIMYFLDDSYLKANAVLSNIEQFVNGFKIEKLELKKWDDASLNINLQPAPIAPEWQRARYIHWGAPLLWIAAFFVAMATGIIADPGYLVFGAAGLFVWFRYGPVHMRVKKEKERLHEAYARYAAHKAKLVKEHDNPPDVYTYAQAIARLDKLVAGFRQLPEEGDKMKKLMEERIYNDNLDGYLRQFDIQSHTITAFGPAKKALLQNAGIRNASDISRLLTTRVAGIGPKNMQVLLDWRRHMASGFVYIPDTGKLATGLLQVVSDLEALKLKLEHSIRMEFQTVTYMKQNLSNRALVLESQIKDISFQAARARLDMDAFASFSRFM